MTVQNHSTEVWRAVVGYEGAYEVSDAGRVRRVNNLRRRKSSYLLKQGKCKKYRSVALYGEDGRKMQRVHVLVAAAFLGAKPSPLSEVNHINLVKSDNRASNLEYLSHAENMKHAHRNGRGGGIKGEGSPHTKFKAKDVRAIRKAAASGVRRSALALQYAVSLDCIHGIVSRRRWKHI